ncbi:MAG: hypothetical protein NT033_04760 [Candidatus Omnitrophica bacterium]|nr:hypothetical protein [Candidatus Omnitrophota bacterium]
MEKYLKNLPREILDLIYLARDISVREGVPAYLVGGCVRDLLLGEKNFDLDIVVEGDAMKFADNFSKATGAKIIRHNMFGTATVFISHKLKVDFATSRKEYYPHPAALPVVSPSVLKDDLLRRDFTVNAMAVDITTGHFGALIDYFHGQDDLAKKKIRVLHALSFIDDPTRILRAIRFEQRFMFRIEPGTLKILKEALKRDMLNKVKPQRIRQELVLLLKEADPVKQLKRMQQLCGLRFLSPKLLVSKEVFFLMRKLQLQLQWYARIQPPRRQLDIWLIYFMALVDGLGKSEINSICRRLMLRAGEAKRALEIKSITPLFISKLRRKDILPSQVNAFLEPLSFETLILLRARYNNVFFRRHIADFLTDYSHVRIHITGKDLLGLGIIPGPAYQRILAGVKDARLDDRVTTKEDEMFLAQRLARKR